MTCLLCLQIPKKSIAIFGDEGLSLGIKTIINKHFWLQLKDDDNKFNLICSPCWKSVQSFHKFYQKVEEAHRLFAEQTSVNQDKIEWSDCPMDEIKTEMKDELITEQLELELPIETVVEYGCDQTDQDDDSDSEIPLSKLTEQLFSNKKEANEPNEKKTKSPKQENIHIQDGKWLATCFGQETTTKPISTDELDKFIKLNYQLSCEICHMPVKDFSTLQTHFKNNHPVKTFVTCCDKKFELRCRLVDHILLHKLPNYFTCVICSRVLSCRLNLRKHMTVHEEKQILQCDKCDKTFSRKEALNRHVLDIHTLDRKFKCEECEKLFASKCSLNTHVYGVHKGRYKKICEQCGKVSCDQETFLRHKMKHSNEPQQYFQCPQCTVKLVSKHGLRHHIRYQHSQDTKEHVCNVCGTVANNESALKRHITFMHKYKRDFKCTLCEKAFKRALTLKEHMTTHTGEVLYTCPHCPKTFNSNANMHSHRKKMHRKEWEENRRHPHLGTSANAKANADAMAAAAAAAAAAEESHQQ